MRFFRSTRCSPPIMGLVVGPNSVRNGGQPVDLPRAGHRAGRNHPPRKRPSTPSGSLRPYFDRFQDYEQVRVTTGWVTAIADGDTLAHERIVTDPEWVWDRHQSRTLPAVYDYVMDRHDGNPRGGGADAPFFGTLTVELELSEPDYRLGVDNEIISTMDALHEEFYFGTIEFFHLIGRNAARAGPDLPGTDHPRHAAQGRRRGGARPGQPDGLRDEPPGGRCALHDAGRRIG